MSSPPARFDAGRPRLSGPLRRLARPLGPLALPLAGTRWLPLYAILRHTGRKSGKEYSTPVVTLRTSDGFLIPLPFGDATQWARNLFASGGGRLKHAGRDYETSEPRVIDRGAANAQLPMPVRVLARLFGLRQFVFVRRIRGGGVSVSRSARRSTEQRPPG
jgi:deazaflavin-dependent oxidoreductase (nitroreductase family)